MCEIYYLDHFREAVAEQKAEETAKQVVEAEELMQKAKASMKMMSERTAKLMLDLAFNKITYISDEAGMERLIRYADELLRKANHDLIEKQDCEVPFFTADEMQDCEMAIKTYLEDQLEDN